MTKRFYSIPLATLLVAVLSACVTSGAGGTGGSGTRQDVITQTEIQAAGLSTMYDVVQRLRPRWLTVRADQSFGLQTEVVVYQDQTFLGGPDALRRLSPDMAYSLRYLDGITASATLPGLGSRHVEGAIVIDTRAP